MADFDLKLYHEEIAKLREHLREMDVALDNLKFESGPGGVSSSATTHLHSYNTEYLKLSGQVAMMVTAMLPGMKDE